MSVATTPAILGSWLASMLVCIENRPRRKIRQDNGTETNGFIGCLMNTGEIAA